MGIENLFINLITKYRKFFSEKIFSLGHDFISLVFPEICSSCGKNLFKNEISLCTHCLYHLPKTNFHLENDNPVAKIFWGRINIEAAASFYTFNKGGKVQHLIHQLKYKGQQHVGTTIGKLYGQELLNTPDFNSIDLIVPVPLHKTKQRKRGYNQSACFAQGLAMAMNRETDSTVLFRSFSSQTQTKKSRFTRWKNVETIFYTKIDERLQYKHILLVDDVITTGATLEACAQALSKIKGVKLSIATIAYAAN
jgi:ComF family protein